MRLKSSNAQGLENSKGQGFIQVRCLLYCHGNVEDAMKLSWVFHHLMLLRLDKKCRPNVQCSLNLIINTLFELELTTSSNSFGICSMVPSSANPFSFRWVPFMPTHSRHIQILCLFFSPSGNDGILETQLSLWQSQHPHRICFRSYHPRWLSCRTSTVLLLRGSHDGSYRHFTKNTFRFQPL